MSFTSTKRDGLCLRTKRTYIVCSLIHCTTRWHAIREISLWMAPMGRISPVVPSELPESYIQPTMLWWSLR